MEKEAGISEKVTLEDYIKIDEAGAVRHEFYYGKLFAMPGETLLHNEVCIKILILLRSIVLGKGFKAYMESVKVAIENEQIYLYPDIVVCRPQENKGGFIDRYVVKNPILIAEILSDSTRKYDSTDKFIQYQKLSSLQYYLLVEPEKHVIIFYEKDETGEWMAKTFTEMDETVMLPKVEAQISLGDVYA